MEIYLLYNGKHNILLDGVIMYNRICNVILSAAYFPLKGFSSRQLRASTLLKASESLVQVDKKKYNAANHFAQLTDLPNMPQSRDN